MRREEKMEREIKRRSKSTGNREATLEAGATLFHVMIMLARAFRDGVAASSSIMGRHPTLHYWLGGSFPTQLILDGDDDDSIQFDRMKEKT